MESFCFQKSPWINLLQRHKHDVMIDRCALMINIRVVPGDDVFWVLVQLLLLSSVVLITPPWPSFPSVFHYSAKRPEPDMHRHAHHHKHTCMDTVCVCVCACILQGTCTHVSLCHLCSSLTIRQGLLRWEALREPSGHSEWGKISLQISCGKKYD